LPDGFCRRMRHRRNPTSLWATLNIESKLRAILGSVAYPHHFSERPFVTPYQLAIEFARLHPTDFGTLAMPIGGVGTGPSSLSQYIARELSQRIKAGTIIDIEGSFLANLHLDSLSFDDVVHGVAVMSSLTGSAYPVSLFRVKEGNQMAVSNV
jgi:hypothetical protein